MHEGFRHATELLRNEMADTLHSMIGRSMTSAKYFATELDDVYVFEGLCDVCPYGIEFELNDGTSVSIVRAEWTHSLDNSLFVDRNHSVKNYFSREEIDSPLVPRDISNEGRWRRYIGSRIAGVALFAELPCTLYAPQDLRGELNPQHLKIDFECGESLFVYSGTYSSQHGFGLNNFDSLVVVFGEKANKKVMAHGMLAEWLC